MPKEKEKPLTRKDVERKIKEHDNIARGLDLSGKTFEEGIDLQALNLEGIILKDARFPTHFEGNELVGAKFNGSNLTAADLRNINLQYAQFGVCNGQTTCLEAADLRGTILLNANFQCADLSCAKFGKVDNEDFRPATLENTDFRKANLFLANFKGCYFYGTKLEGAFIRGADIYEAHLEEANWGNYIIGEEKKKEELHFAGNVYRRLKIWYNRAGRYDIAGKFFFREQESYRKLVQFAKPRRIKQFWMLIWFWIYKLTCGYGEKPQRVGISAAIVIFGSALSYWGGGMDMLYSLYFSAVSFTALGYGGWVYPPSASWMQTVGAIESFFGVSIMALFLVTFVRKMSR